MIEKTIEKAVANRLRAFLFFGSIFGTLEYDIALEVEPLLSAACRQHQRIDYVFIHRGIFDMPVRQRNPDVAPEESAPPQFHRIGIGIDRIIHRLIPDHRTTLVVPLRGSGPTEVEPPAR